MSKIQDRLDLSYIAGTCELPRRQPQKFVVTDFDEHDLEVVLFFDLVELGATRVVLANFIHVKLRHFCRLIGLEKIALVFPFQDNATGIVARINFDRNRISNGRRFDHSLQHRPFLSFERDCKGEQKHQENDSANNSICQVSVRRLFDGLSAHFGDCNLTESGH
jgi:hypothetical protein